MNPVLMLCRNQKAITIQAVDSIFNQTIPIELYVVCNGATDGTAQYLNSLYHTHRNVHIIHNYPGKGVAASWNQILRHLFRSPEYPGRVALVINNDVILRPDTYQHLLAQGGPFVTGIGVRGYQHNPNELKFYNDFGVEIFPGGPVSPGTRLHPDFSCFLIRKSVWDTVGEFDEEFKGAYAEDCDYHVRMHRAGIEAVCIDLPFYHYGAGTINNSTKEVADAIGEQANRNRAYFKSKYGCDVGTPEYEALFQ